jgi:cytochrome c-type biogenesis protein CcmH/NrfG
VSYSAEDVQKLVDELTKTPNDSEKWHILGVAYLSLNEADKAENAFKHCLKLDKDNAYALGDLGSLYILKGKNKQAIQHLERSVKIEPSKFEYWSALGVAYFQKGKYNQAVEAFHSSLAINPIYYDAIVSLGMTYSKMEQWEEALVALTQAEALIPNNYHALSAIAKSLRNLNRMQELEQLHLRMHSLFPQDPSQAMYLGQIAFNSGRIKEGLDYYKKAVEIDPESLIGWKVFAEALERIGRKEEAQAAHDKYKEIGDDLKRANTRLVG